jgi:hypothetical protein
VIGASAPIHPRVDPAVRPGVSIRADLLLFARDTHSKVVKHRVTFSFVINAWRSPASALAPQSGERAQDSTYNLVRVRGATSCP